MTAQIMLKRQNSDVTSKDEKLQKHKRHVVLRVDLPDVESRLSRCADGVSVFLSSKLKFECKIPNICTLMREEALTYKHLFDGFCGQWKNFRGYPQDYREHEDFAEGLSDQGWK